MPAAERDAPRGRRHASVLAEQVHPAFAALQALRRGRIHSRRRATSSRASTLPAGPAYYELRVREQTTTDARRADEIHEIGLREVARIRAEMDAGDRRDRLQGHVPRVPRSSSAAIRSSSSRRPRRACAAYRDIAKRADAELPKLFAELPRLPYGIRAMEAYEGDNADHYSPRRARRQPRRASSRPT